MSITLHDSTLILKFAWASGQEYAGTQSNYLRICDDVCGDVYLNILSKWMAMKSKGCDNMMLDFKETHMLGTTRIQMDSRINTSAKPTTKQPNSSEM